MAGPLMRGVGGGFGRADFRRGRFGLRRPGGGAHSAGANSTSHYVHQGRSLRGRQLDRQRRTGVVVVERASVARERHAGWLRRAGQGERHIRRREQILFVRAALFELREREQIARRTGCRRRHRSSLARRQRLHRLSPPRRCVSSTRRRRPCSCRCRRRTRRRPSGRRRAGN